jgi:hypothetical protein
MKSRPAAAGTALGDVGRSESWEVVGELSAPRPKWEMAGRMSILATASSQFRCLIRPIWTLPSHRVLIFRQPRGGAGVRRGDPWPLPSRESTSKLSGRTTLKAQAGGRFGAPGVRREAPAASAPTGMLVIQRCWCGSFRAAKARLIRSACASVGDRPRVRGGLGAVGDVELVVDAL